MNKLLQVSCLMIAGGAAAFPDRAYGQENGTDLTTLAAARQKLWASVGASCAKEGMAEGTPTCFDGKMVVCLNQKWSLQDAWGYYKCWGPPSIKREVWRIATNDDPNTIQEPMTPMSNMVDSQRSFVPWEPRPLEGAGCDTHEKSLWQTRCNNGRFAVCLNKKWSWKQRWVSLGDRYVSGPIALREDGVVRAESQGYRAVYIDSCEHNQLQTQIDYISIEDAYYSKPSSGGGFTPGFVGIAKSRPRAKTGISIRMRHAA